MYGLSSKAYVLSLLFLKMNRDSFWPPFGTEPNYVMVQFSCVLDGPFAEEIGGGGDNTWSKNSTS